MIRGWIRGKATRNGKISKDLNRSNLNLRKLQYESVDTYQYMVYGDGHDDYDEYWLDNFYDPWLHEQQQKPIKIQRKRIKTTPSPKPIKIMKPKKSKSIQSIPKPQQVVPTPIPVPIPAVVPAKPKKEMIADIEHKKTDSEEKEYSTLNEEYIAKMSAIETHGIYSSCEGLAERSTYSSHKDDKADPQNENIKKIMREIR